MTPQDNDDTDHEHETAPDAAREAELRTAIKRLEAKAIETPDWQPTPEIERRIDRVKTELEDPALLLPETDLREVDAAERRGGRL